jgi:hypothetical protein
MRIAWVVKRLARYYSSASNVRLRMPATCLSLLVCVLILAGTLDAQAPADLFQPVATMKHLSRIERDPARRQPRRAE